MNITFSLVLILPIFSFLVICIFGHKLGTYGSMIFSVINIVTTFLLSVLLFIYNSFDIVSYVELYN